LNFKFKLNKGELTFYGSSELIDKIYDDLMKKKSFEVDKKEVFMDTYTNNMIELEKIELNKKLEEEKQNQIKKQEELNKLEEERSSSIAMTSPFSDDDLCNGEIICPICGIKYKRDECVENKTLDEKVTVVIEMDDGVNLTELNTVEELGRIKELSEKGGEEVKIGYVIDEQGYITRIIIYVDDEETARGIAKTVESMEKGEGCSYGILCKRKNVHVKTMEREISGIENIHCMEKKRILIIMVVIIILMRRM